MVESPDPEAAVRDAIRHWSKLQDLVKFAGSGHGFGDNDGGFGITYPGDLDDYNRSKGQSIPAGKVAVYGYWGPPDGYEILVDESMYLAYLVMVLKENGLLKEAVIVQSLLN